MSQSFPDMKNSLKNPKVTEYSVSERILKAHRVQFLNDPQGGSNLGVTGTRLQPAGLNDSIQINHL